MALVTSLLFGSCSRGDEDKQSDIDVLVVVDDGDTTIDSATREAITTAFGARTELSVYSVSRLAEMFRTGHLFAWHLWQDSSPGPIPGTTPDLLANLGQPSPCPNALQEAKDLHEDLTACVRELRNGTNSPRFEAGLVYICLRNIAIQLSWYLPNGPTFSRHSPYVVGEFASLPCPLPKKDYDQLHLARRLRSEFPPQEAHDLSLPSHHALAQTTSWSRALIEQFWSDYV